MQTDTVPGSSVVSSPLPPPLPVASPSLFLSPRLNCFKFVQRAESALDLRLRRLHRIQRSEDYLSRKPPPSSSSQAAWYSACQCLNSSSSNSSVSVCVSEWCIASLLGCCYRCDHRFQCHCHCSGSVLFSSGIDPPNINKSNYLSWSWRVGGSNRRVKVGKD